MDHWQLKMFPWSTMPRFYPPGEHPAMTSYYETLRLAEEVRDTYGGGEAIDQHIEYLQEKIASFEGVESEIKAMCALMDR